MRYSPRIMPSPRGRHGLALTAMIATLASGTTLSYAADVEFWSPFTGPDGATIEAMVQEYNDTRGAEADVNVDLLIVPWDQYYTKLTVSMASGTAPDLSIAHSHRVAGFVGQGALTAFSEDDLKTAGIEGDDYIEALWNAGSVEGERYAVPIDAFPRHIYYNKKLFEEAGLDPEAPPRTLQELRAAAEAISALGDDVYGVYFALQGSSTARDFYSIYWQYTPELLSEDQRGVADGFEEAATKTLTQLKSFIDEGLAPAQNIEDYEGPFIQDRIGVAISQITELPLFRDTEGLDYGVSPMPTFGDTPATFALGHNFAIPTGTSDEAREAALDFISWFSAHGYEWAVGGKVPAKLAVIESDEFKALGPQNIIAERRDIMKLPPIIAVQPEIDRVVQEHVEAVYAGQLTVDDAVSRMKMAIEDVLASQ